MGVIVTIKYEGHKRYTMDIMAVLLVKDETLNAAAMGLRAACLFFVALLLIRFSGMRIFGKKSAFDSIIVIMMGAVLARGIVGASPLLSTVAAAAVMIVINRRLALLSVKFKFFNNLIKGKAILLFRSGEILWDNMRKAAMSKSDLLESLRLETHRQDLELVEEAYMETNGRISFILKEGRR